MEVPMANDRSISELEAMMVAGFTRFLTDPEATRFSDEAIESFFARQTLGELRTILEGVSTLLAERAHRFVGLADDSVVIHRAIARLIETTEGAETARDVLERRPRDQHPEPVSGAEDEDAAHFAVLVDWELSMMQHRGEGGVEVCRRSDGRVWSPSEVYRLLTVDEPTIPGPAVSGELDA
jgi:hypothetical protein